MYILLGRSHRNKNTQERVSESIIANTCLLLLYIKYNVAKRDMEIWLISSNEDSLTVVNYQTVLGNQNISVPGVCLDLMRIVKFS